MNRQMPEMDSRDSKSEDFRKHGFPITFKREMNRNYMVLEAENAKKERYAVQMFTGNRIPGFLPLCQKQINGESLYYYDITSRQPLERMLDVRQIKEKELENLVADLLSALGQIERFLLDEGCMCLDPELIYVDPDSFQCVFCYIPGYEGNFPSELRELSQYLLDHVDHRDGDAVVLAFAVFRECRKENFGLEDIAGCLKRGKTEEILAGTDIADDKREWPETEQEDPKKRLREDLQKQSKRDDMREDLQKRSKRDGMREDIQKRSMTGLWEITAMIALMAAGPIIVSALWGMEGLFQLKWILGAAELALGCALLGWIMKNRTMEKGRCVQDRSESEEHEEEPWEVWFETDEEKAETVSVTQEEDMQTVLLTVHPIEHECRKLISVTGDIQIPVNYFPFLIGKNRELADFCLNEPGVSRLHVRLEEKDNGYIATDLNSTNGTKIDGVLLEANESRRLPVGGVLEIAGRKFRFQ